LEYATLTVRTKWRREADMALERVQRRLAAILAADVVGFSRLTRLDEEGTAHRLRELQVGPIDSAVAAHGGRIFKTTGDGLLIEFASVVDAVRCALEIQRRLTAENKDFAPERQIEFRIAVHLGDVMAQPDGDLLGDGVNIAARLEGMAEPGGVCLSGAAYEQVRDKLREHFSDLGDKALKNIARPTRVYAVNVGLRSTAPATFSAAGEEKVSAPHFSVVVLPFANIGGDPQQDYFADGVTESLTTDLSRIVGAFVIARNTAFAYKGKSINIKQIARELNVRYVLEGSVQRSHGRMRINVQLVDAEAGNHIWAERFDKPIADLFDMQDEIVSRLAAQLEAKVIAAEARRAEGSVRPDAIDHIFQGLAAFYSGWSPECLHKAQKFFQSALALEPNNMLALHSTAVVDIVACSNFQSDDRVARLAGAEKKLQRVLSIEPSNARAFWSLGAVMLNTKRHLAGIAAFERALTLDQNLAGAHADLGSAKLFINRADETEAHVRTALRLSPRDNFAFDWLIIAGVSQAFLGAYEEAAVWFRRSIEANRNNPTAHFFLAALLAHLGRNDEANAVVKDALALDPDFTIARLRAGMQSDLPTYVTFYEGALRAMRKAGVPEG
jgi:TolB-like protein/class 3 adenylate cyclase